MGTECGSTAQRTWTRVRGSVFYPFLKHCPGLRHPRKNPIMNKIQELEAALDHCRQLNDKLTDEIKELNKRLAEAESLKSHFVSNVANEIVNPFSSILGLSKSILSCGERNWKRINTMASMVYSETINLDFQLKNIFAAAKIEAGEVEIDISNVDIRQLIRSLIGHFDVEAKKKEVSIRFMDQTGENTSRLFIRTDAEKIHLILSNLLSNAIKFNYRSGVVIIKMAGDAKGIDLWMKDSGKGISEFNQEIIFDRFRRIDSGINSINRGHGLGLSVTKASLDLINGSLDFTSAPGKGTEFHLFIPSASDNRCDVAVDGCEFLFEDFENEESF